MYWLQAALAVPTRKPTTQRRARIACSDIGKVVGVVGKGSALAAAVTPNCAPTTCQKINLVQPQPVLRHQNLLSTMLVSSSREPRHAFVAVALLLLLASAAASTHASSYVTVYCNNHSPCIACTRWCCVVCGTALTSCILPCRTAAALATCWCWTAQVGFTLEWLGLVLPWM